MQWKINHSNSNSNSGFVWKSLPIRHKLKIEADRETSGKKDGKVARQSKVVTVT